MVYILFVIGFVLLIVGANVLVDGASSIGRRINLSPLVIGFTIVALGTSLPELLINIFASVRGQSELAITNVLGSNIMNTLFIIGVSALLFPLVPGRRSMFTLVPISLLSAAMLMLFANTHLFASANTPAIDRIEGIIFLLFIVLYLLYSYFFSRSESELVPDSISIYSPLRSILMILTGVLGLYYGGSWVVDGAVVIAANFGMSDALVGITIIAVATSLPELVTSVIAALKKNSGIALGNALGSNIFNVFLVLGISAIIRPLPFKSMLNIDLWVMLLANLVVALFVIAGKGNKINRTEGALMMLIYLTYILWLVMNN
jgi:cation:H+ antiporter